MNNAYRFSGRTRYGITLIASLFLLATGQMKGAEIVVTVTGEVVGGAGDFLHIFGKERNLAGKPVTVVFTFDDTKGKPIPLAGCQGSATGIIGDGENSPGTAVLTINGKSFEFGTHKGRHSETWREISSGCSTSRIIFHVEDSVGRGKSMIQVNIHPADRGRSLTQNPDWRAPMSATSIEQDDRLGGFDIQGPEMSGDGGIFNVKSITIAPKQASR
jgi:hypothetical protein